MAKKAEQQKRRKTGETGIYYNETTKKYDVKYNYKVYDPLKQRNKYKAKWVYNIPTKTEAKAELARLRTNGVKADDKDITLEGAYKLWEIRAHGQNFSPVTIRNTQEQCRMIYQFLPKDTKIKDITDDVYQNFSAEVRKHGYSEETRYNINAALRKLVRLCYKKRLIKENPIDFWDNIQIKKKDDYRLIPKEDFDEIDKYFQKNSFYRLGVNNYPKYRLLFNLLYFTGMRIGEVLALTYEDFETFSYYKRGDEPNIRLAPSSKDARGEHLRGMRVKVTKAYVSDIKLTKDPKNFKHRTIPLSPYPERLFMRLEQEHKQNEGLMTDRIFDWTHGACDTALKKACKECDLPAYHCHEFRHTFISNMIAEGVPLPVIEKVSGDTQETILKRYSHMFESDETLILLALQKL